MTFGAPLAFARQKLRWTPTKRIETITGDLKLVGISFNATDIAPSFNNVSPRTGKFFSILQVATDHVRATRISVGGRQGYWPRDTWSQPLTCTFNTPGGTTALSMPLSVNSSTSVERVHQGLSHVSFSDACELENGEEREFTIVNGSTQFDWDLMVFRMLPDGLDIDSMLPNRTFVTVFTGSGSGWSWTVVDDPREWYNYRPRWYRSISTSGSLLVFQTPATISPPDVRIQFSHNLTFRFRRSQAHSPVAYTITMEILDISLIVVQTYSINIPIDDTIETRVYALPLNADFFSFRFTVPANAKFEVQAYTERTYAP